jgi:hypothetical protein
LQLVGGQLLKRPLIAIHGANSDRKWVGQATSIFDHHFAFHRLEYDRYDGALGATAAVINLPCLIVALLCFFASSVIWLVEWWLTPLALVCALAILYPGIRLAKGGRDRIASGLRSDVEGLGYPHVIAHSLGTFIFGRLLTKFPSTDFENVILVSGVLPDDFDWSRILLSKPGCVSNVRNEFGDSDSVTKFVGLLQPILGDLGRSGVSGFIESDDVHNNHSATAKCDVCATVPAKVHNHLLPLIDHSGALNEGQARSIWLPFLWGFTRSEISEYFRLCQSAVEYGSGGFHASYASAIADLWSRTFTWTKGQTLDDYVREHFLSMSQESPLPAGKSVNDLVRLTRRFLPLVTYLAVSESKKPNPKSSVVYPLHPEIAVYFAVQISLTSA